MAVRYIYVKETRKKSSLNYFTIRIGVYFFLLAFFLSLIVNQFTDSTHAYLTPVIEKPVLQVTKTIELTPTPLIIPKQVASREIPQVIPTIAPTLYVPKKISYSIALFGDSMEDTMETGTPYLNDALKNKYPQIDFKLYNYGVGAQNVSQGLDRLCNQFDYKDRHYPSLCELKPDIIILGSFAYNPFTPYERDKHWINLTKLIEEAKKITSNVYLLAENAPLQNGFGKGVNGVNWDDNTSYVHSLRIEEQLENALGLAKTLNIPLVDAFSKSKIKRKSFVNPSDGIHPSVLGHQMIADQIASTLQLSK